MKGMREHTRNEGADMLAKLSTQLDPPDDPYSNTEGDRS